MAKKPTKKATPTPKYDSEREARVLLEHVNKSITTVSKQHESVVKRLDDMSSELYFTKIAALENSGGIKILKDDLKIVKKGQEGLDGRLDRVEQKLDTVLTDHEQRIQKLETVR